jgi:hypothetical protein
MALMIVPGSLFPLILFSKLVLLMACTRESVPFAFCSASLSCLWLVQGSLFPLLSLQQACLAFDLVKGLCSLSLYCWSLAHFWSIIFLHLIKKKTNIWTVIVQLLLSCFWTVTVQPLLKFLTISWVIELYFKRGWPRWKAKTRGYKFSEGRRTQFIL